MSSVTAVELIPKRPRSVPHGITESGPALLPLEPGQQYRFTFDMNACIGCHSCEVACAEQNNLPVEVAWRRVGEIEGGSFPTARRFHLSMACNHCLEPACLEGCPTGAYVKLPNGIVDHHADDCIGCQYCTWNCPYSVPAFQPDRRIVTKCDMCKPRLEQGFTSACVSACPTHAIGIEVVDVAAWRADHGAADGPNLPPASLTVSTTRLILPPDLPAATESGGDWSIQPEHPHWPLVAVTILTQAAAGLFCAEWLGALAGAGARAERVLALVAALIAHAGLASAMIHLGRPTMAWKALRGLRRSWLSREILGFFAFSATSVAAVLVPSALTFGCAAVVGLTAAAISGRLYTVPGRPSWNTPLTPLSFVLSGLATGAALSSAMGGGLVSAVVALCGLLGSLACWLGNLARLAASDRLEWRGTWVLTVGPLRTWAIVRLVTALAAAGPALAGYWWPAAVLAGATELVTRWLFFVSVVPLSMPGAFFRGRR